MFSTLEGGGWGVEFLIKVLLVELDIPFEDFRDVFSFCIIMNTWRVCYTRIFHLKISECEDDTSFLPPSMNLM